MRRRDFIAAVAAVPALGGAGTRVEIRGNEFWINGQPTYPGRVWQGHKIQGLLMNSRMVQGIFDDANPQTAQRWAYPDTGKWDPERNTREFIAAMPEWRKSWLLGFTINMHGGSPQGYSKEQPWINTGLNPDGTLRADYQRRLDAVLARADELGMVAIVGYFYFGQDERLNGDDAVRRAVHNMTEYLLSTGRRNILVEIANECDNRSYEQPLLRANHIHELIQQCKSMRRGSRRLPVGASFNGGSIPTANVVAVSDFVLIHGNGVKDPKRITEMVEQVRRVKGYRPMPVMFNEDDHFDFDKAENNMAAAVKAYASWGYFDPGESNYRDGYQCPPVNWGINTDRKKAFFEMVRQVTGA